MADRRNEFKQTVELKTARERRLDQGASARKKKREDKNNERRGVANFRGSTAAAAAAAAAVVLPSVTTSNDNAVSSNISGETFFDSIENLDPNNNSERGTAGSNDRPSNNDDAASTSQPPNESNNNNAENIPGLVVIHDSMGGMAGSNDQPNNNDDAASASQPPNETTNTNTENISGLAETLFESKDPQEMEEIMNHLDRILDAKDPAAVRTLLGAEPGVFAVLGSFLKAERSISQNMTHKAGELSHKLSLQLCSLMTKAQDRLAPFQLAKELYLNYFHRQDIPAQEIVDANIHNIVINECFKLEHRHAMKSIKYAVWLVGELATNPETAGAVGLRAAIEPLLEIVLDDHFDEKTKVGATLALTSLLRHGNLDPQQTIAAMRGMRNLRGFVGTKSDSLLVDATFDCCASIIATGDEVNIQQIISALQETKDAQKILLERIKSKQNEYTTTTTVAYILLLGRMMADSNGTLVSDQVKTLPPLSELVQQGVLSELEKYMGNDHTLYLGMQLFVVLYKARAFDTILRLERFQTNWLPKLFQGIKAVEDHHELPPHFDKIGLLINVITSLTFLFGTGVVPKNLQRDGDDVLDIGRLGMRASKDDTNPKNASLYKAALGLVKAYLCDFDTS